MAEGLFGRLGGHGRSSKDTASNGTASKDAAHSEFEVKLSDEEWRRRLTPEQYRVLRQHGTERAGTSPLDKNYDPGTLSLRRVRPAAIRGPRPKFNSRTGWPSFYAPLENASRTQTDRGFFMVRTEVHCRPCGGHLGHVFDDGPQPTGQRYCMNGVSLDFQVGESEAAPPAMPEQK